MAVSLRVIGKMGSVMDWEWRVGGSGSTEENGLKDSRVAMESDNQHRHQQSMKEPGPMVFRMAMVQRRMLMEVRDFWNLFQNRTGLLLGFIKFQSV